MPLKMFLRELWPIFEAFTLEQTITGLLIINFKMQKYIYLVNRYIILG